MESKIGSIPVIDCENNIASAASKILSAIQSVGFVYLKNFGISEEHVQEAFDAGSNFWNLPLDLKLKYSKIIDTNGHFNKTYTTTGYIAPGAEIFNKRLGNELRESYDNGLFDQRLQIFPPDDIVPGFENTATSFFYRCHSLSLEILRAICSAAGFQDKDYFTGIHRLDESIQTFANLRLAHYPAFQQNVAGNLCRCGEHTDFGTITLLFQDSVGGLEIADQSGNFVPAHPLPGAVLVNAGDMLQIWTNDKIKAITHRVLPVLDADNWSRERRSIAFFMHPQANFKVQPIVEGTEVAHYMPTTHGEHFLKTTADSFY